MFLVFESFKKFSTLFFICLPTVQRLLLLWGAYLMLCQVLFMIEPNCMFVSNLYYLMEKYCPDF